MKVYLIPTFLGDCDEKNVFPPLVSAVLQEVEYFVVENLRTARRNLRKMGYTRSFDEVQFFELNEHNVNTETEQIINEIGDGIIGIMSEAGVPGVADPGSSLVLAAHKRGAKIIPLTGPSSILLSLMASGLNGQSFAFNGYLPVDKQERKNKIRAIEKRSAQEHQTQIFIETPYRNNALLADLVSTLSDNTLLCIAVDVTLESESIQTQTIAQWRKKMPDINKRPAIFLFLLL
jgi:16S rRNA (cytidine1402-2'-O)-methyltransferase